jgi:hypothetical protein
MNDWRNFSHEAFFEKLLLENVLRRISLIFFLLDFLHVTFFTRRKSANERRKSLFQIFAFVITSLYSSVSFNKDSLNSDSSVQDIKGFLIILATEVLFTFVYAVFMLVYEVLPLLRKETGVSKLPFHL